MNGRQNEGDIERSPSWLPNVCCLWPTGKIK